MALSKKVYDKNVPTRNLVSTITGILTLLLAVLVGFGVLTPEQSTELQQQAMTILQAVVGVIGAIQAIILIFKVTDSEPIA